MVNQSDPLMHSTETVSMDEALEDIQFCNEELKTYIKSMSGIKSTSLKSFQDITTRQKSRQLSQMRNVVEVSQWLANALGLDITGFTVTPTGVESTPIEMMSIDSDTDKAQDLTNSIIYLLDKYCVSDSFYHELTMLDEHLPRSYLIKQSRRKLNDQYTVTPTPNSIPGAYMSFKVLLHQRVATFLEQHPEKKNKTIKIKICGDGAKISRVANYISLSFSIVDECASTMAANGIHTIGIINAAESYDSIAAGFQNVVNEIHDTVKQGNIKVDGETIQLELFTGGDLKFLLLIYGLSSASSTYACLYCKVPKSERWDTTRPLNHYNSPPHLRTLEEIVKIASQKKRRFQCSL